MTKKKDPKDLKPVGRVPEVLLRYGYDKDKKKKTYPVVLEKIQADIKNYIAERGDSLTVTGLMLALGYNEKTTFYDDCRLKNYPELSALLKGGRVWVEDSYEKRLHGTTATGSIFALKNMGWSDRQVIEDTLTEDEKKRLFD